MWMVTYRSLLLVSLFVNLRFTSSSQSLTRILYKCFRINKNNYLSPVSPPPHPPYQNKKDILSVQVNRESKYGDFVCMY